MPLLTSREQRMLGEPAVAETTTPPTSGTAYFTYMGYTLVAFTPKFVWFCTGAAGAGAQTAEIGLFSTPQAPNRAAQSLTKLVATGNLTNLAAAFAAQSNTVAFATVIGQGVHLWAGLRTAMAVTQPSIYGWAFDMASSCLVTPASGVLTGAGPFAGVTVFGGGVANCLRFAVTID